MTATKTISETELCGSLYNDLMDIKARLLDLAARMEGVAGPEAEHLRSHVSHLNDIVRTIDWKLDIFAKVCPTSPGAFAGGVEGTVSVPETKFEKEPISGGYMGG